MFRSSASWIQERKRILAAPDEKILEMTGQICYWYPMKRVYRYRPEPEWVPLPHVHLESNADHVAALVYLSRIFAPLELTGEPYSIELIVDAILYHDFLEIRTGDKPYHQKTEEDRLNEHSVADEEFGQLLPFLRGSAQHGWRECEFPSTREGRFVEALDKIEPLFELQHAASAMSLRRLEMTYEQHIEKKLNSTKEFPVMRKFITVVSDDMKRKNLFWVPPENRSAGSS